MVKERDPRSMEEMEEITHRGKLIKELSTSLFKYIGLNLIMFMLNIKTKLDTIV